MGIVRARIAACGDRRYVSLVEDVRGVEHYVGFLSCAVIGENGIECPGIFWRSVRTQLASSRLNLGHEVAAALEQDIAERLQPSPVQN